jgi:Ca2+-dependent lipid-binding protein
MTGTSDPYVRCVQGQDKLFQTRSIAKTVNPVWDETFESYIDNPFRPITFQASPRANPTNADVVVS